MTSSRAGGPLTPTGAGGVQTLELCGGLNCGKETTRFLRSVSRLMIPNVVLPVADWFRHVMLSIPLEDLLVGGV